MKKKILICLFAMLMCAVAVACSEPAPPPKSTDTSLTVQTVAGATVADGAVALSAAQWDVLVGAENKADVCGYVLADKAMLSVNLNGAELTFAVMAESGDRATYTVTVSTKSSAAELALTSSEAMTEQAGELACTEEFIATLAQAQDVATLIPYTASQGARVEMYYDKVAMRLTATVTSEDESNATNYAWDVVMKKIVLTHKFGEDG